jgi:TonB family protein
MRILSRVTSAALLAASSLPAQTSASGAAAPQTARQALLEMFFGQAPDHLEKHLPDVTRWTFQKLEGEIGQSFLRGFSMLAARAKAGNEKFETFDSGSTLFTLETPYSTDYKKIAITVEGDRFHDAEDDIELALRVIRKGEKEEEAFPIVPHFNFSMKMESQVWRLNEINLTGRLPLADPGFLKSLEESRRRQNEQMAQWSVRAVLRAEKSYQGTFGSFACTLSALRSAGKAGPVHPGYLYDAQLAGGKKNGYNFSISGCDGTGYQAWAEPATADSGQRAFCAGQSGTIRAAPDGKATTCIASGEVVEKVAAGISSPGGGSQLEIPHRAMPDGVSLSEGVAQELLLNQVQPVYPPVARNARITGTVVLKAQISETGEVVSLSLISGHPLLAPAAMDAVKQWKYRPYLLNGSPVEVNTEVRVNFALSGK